MSNRDDRIDYLDSERKKIWEKIVILEDLVAQKTSDYEESAKTSSEQALQSKQEADEARNTILQNLEETSAKLITLRDNYATFEKLLSDVKGFAETSSINNSLISTLYDSVKSKSESIQSQIAEIEKLVDGKPALDEKLTRLQTVFTQGDEYDSKLKVLFNSITERKKEIDALYFEIIGFSEKNEAGEETTRVEGLKEQLASAFDESKTKLEKLEDRLIFLEKETGDKYDQFFQAKSVTFDSSFKDWEGSYTTIKNKIEELLPNALTAGLSSAYSEKKLTEERESRSFAFNFKIAIAGLLLISLIPFWVSIQSLIDKVALEEVIKRIPRLVVAILPLYVPVLWLAYSYNRKMNLSKRLIEEYSHKEVLSKTFEGLSRQINSIDDQETSSDLRTRLLYNILEVNSENPGKLISDYNKSDHPLMDALDKSIKLTNAVTKLSKIPGFTKLAAKLGEKAQEVLDTETQKANAGLEAIKSDKKT